MKQPSNLFSLPKNPTGEEIFEPLLEGRNVRVERIVSSGQSTPEGVWMDQELDEWVALLQGRGVVGYENGVTVELGPGDWIFIPAHTRHRVESTSPEPPCIWLAVHGRLG
jgi:cupin 2 domain-containing protein